MAKKRVNRIELEKFRGATTQTQIDFDDAKPIVVIFGENGSGKSTIGNALDFVCNKSKGSLESLSSTRYSDIVSIGNEVKDLKVRIHQQGSMWEGSQNGNRIDVTPADDIPHVSTLRRSKLLKLVEATPEKRFDTIRSFIDFDKLEASEQKLRDASKRADKNVEDYSRLHTQAQATLDTAWANDGRSGASSTGWALSKIAVDVTASREIVTSCDAALKSIEVFENDRKSVTTTKQELVDAETELAEVEAQITAQQSDAAQSDVKLVEMLESVGAIIADPYNRNKCPACLSDFDLESLRSSIHERIAALENASELGKNHKLKSMAVETRRTLAERSLAKLRASTSGLEGLVCPTLRDTAEFKDLAERLDAIDFEAAAFSDADINTLSIMAADANPVFTTKREAVNRDVNLYDTVRRDLDLVDSTLADVQAEDLIAKRLSKALEIVHSTRIKATQDILDAVFDDFLRYWQAIHPGEPLKPTKLSLSETSKGSLSQIGSFCGHDDISPQAYFSESHLDTLGFCYWLAIAKYSTDGDTVLVLDDVFTSVDNEHLGRIIDLLVAESETFNQILLFTHQRRWHDAFRYGAKSQGKVHVIELGMWDLTAGITTYPTRMEVEKLTDLLKAAPLDRQAVCGKAGVLLEQMFDELTKQYRSSMPRGPRNEYTLNEYATTTTKLFKKLKIFRPDGSGGTEEIDLEQYHTDLMPFVSVRNQVGAHFNLTSAEFVDGEIVRFGNLTVELISILLCRNCRGLANNMDKASGKWTCECKQTQMLPNSL